jgi:hypothetical protein
MSGSEHIIIIDESGDVGLNIKNPIFTIGAVVVRDPEDFANMSRRLREDLEIGELKYRTADDETRKYVLKRAAETGIRVIAVYIDKRANDNPGWWCRFESKRSKAYRAVFAELISDIMAQDMDNLKVIIDEHSLLKGRWGEDTVRKTAETKGKTIVHVSQERSVDGDHKDLLQSGDIVVGATARMIRYSEQNESIPMDIRRLTCENTKR